MRRLVVIALALVPLAGCGGDDQDDDPEKQAREAVARFFDAFGDADPEAGCEALTPNAQRQVGPLLSRLADEASDPLKAELGNVEDDKGSCAQALAAIFGLAPESTAAQISTFAEQVRTDSETISASADGTSATVTILGSGPDAAIPVAEVDGEWRVADANAILLGTGRE